MKILTINPGSTSTKIALFENDTKLFSVNVSHDAAVLSQFTEQEAQLPYRMETIRAILAENNVDLSGLSACVGRGGGLLACEGGVYEVTDLVLQHSLHAANGVIHPAGLGPSIAHEFAEEYGVKAYAVNPPDVDELQDVARITGIKGVYRNVHLHALNLKETAIRHAASQGKKYEDGNYIVCHIGGGVSVSAHQKGRMIDGYDIVGGEGPMAPTRCGAVPVAEFIEYSEGKTAKELRALTTRTGGFVSHLGTSDAIEVNEKIAAGDAYAALVWEAFIYQIEKGIGAMAAVLKGKVDGILLGGGIVYNEGLVKELKESVGFIAPVYAYPGEFEMEAMAAGAIRVLKGEEQVKIYTGKKVFQGFEA